MSGNKTTTTTTKKNTLRWEKVDNKRRSVLPHSGQNFFSYNINSAKIFIIFAE